MPPKVDITTLVAKRDNALSSLYELFEEFQVVIQIEPGLSIVKNIYEQIEPKYRSFKKLTETIADKGIEIGLASEDQVIVGNKQIVSKVKTDFLGITQNFAVYQKKHGEQQNETSDGLKEMNSTLQKMVESLGAKNNDKGHGLEKLSIPTWDGKRKTYGTWKKEFNYWMVKYKQDKEEQLQRFRKALPKGLWWSDLVKTCRTIENAWGILDQEFGNQRKLMDELLGEITSYKSIKRDPKSLSQFATKISCFVHDMEDNGCQVTSASEAPFVMSQFLSKLDPNDNADFGREMIKESKEENVTNLIEWLHREASIRSRGRVATEVERKVKIESHTTDKEEEQEDCPLCSTKHLLSACPIYQGSTVNQRWDIVRNYSRCRKCLRQHHTNDCRKVDGTTCTQCTKRHHRSLHNGKSFLSTGEDFKLNPSAPAFVGKKNTNNTFLERLPSAAIQQRTIDNPVSERIPLSGVCPVQKILIQDEDGKQIEIIAMLDSGSNTSLLSKNVAKKLGLSGLKTHLTMNLAGGQKRSENTELIKISLTSPTDVNIQKTLNVYTVEKPCSPAKTVSRKSVESFKHLKPISDMLYLSGGAVDLLIGADFPDAFIDIHMRQGNEGDAVAKRNCFGWYLIGRLEKESTSRSKIHSVDVGTVSALEDIKKLLTQDMIGVKPTQLCTCSDNVLKENNFVKSISDSTKFVDGRLQIKMPWNENGPPKRSNYEIALKRMYSSEKTFHRKHCFEEIAAEVGNLIKQGFVKEIPAEQVNHEEPEWYLPMHAVFTPERSTKIRLVFDASAKGHDGQSLNDYLEKGPNYINNLTNVLIAWRWDQTAYTGDIRKMFNQILVHPDDQVFHRFLFRRNINQQPIVYQWERLNFGDKPAPDIATGCINILARSAKKEFPEAAEELRNHTYVDDIGGSKDTTQEAKRITSDVNIILAKGKFQVKAWHSNDDEIDQSEEPCTDFLGHIWNKREDEFSFKKEEITTTEFGKLTKRNCLAMLAQLWDPIGLVSPVTIKFRVDLQELWSSGYSWDDVLPSNLQQQWTRNTEVLNQLLTFTFDRRLKPRKAVGLPELHGFCDGGELAYGAVIFLKWQLEDNNYHCNPLLVKTFVAPLKKKSIPRLELLGCLTLSRIYNTCEDALQFMNIAECKKTFWTDSSTVLSWIKTSPKNFKPFVSARVAEIQENMDVSKFRYVKSKDNPADSLTRGIKDDKLKNWMKGPKFLYSSDLPEESEEDVEHKSEVREEMKTLKKQNFPVEDVNRSEILEADCEVMGKTNPIQEHLMRTCSTFRKARKILSYLLRFVHNAKNSTKKKGQISVEELKTSERQLLKWCQEEIDVSKLDKKLIAKPDADGLLRAHGRLETIQSLPFEMRNPIILPHNNQLVHMLLRQLHEARGHCGYQSLIHESRRKFWVIGLRSIAKQLTRKCITCRKLRKKTQEQLMGQMPSLRVAPGLPVFAHTALDMFGPLQIRLNRKTLMEAQVIIFTCMTVRAVHLELCTDKSTDTFLMAFRRFVSIRGHPLVCWSDCGTNFKGAQTYMEEVMKNWDVEKIKTILAEGYECKFEWKWNVPRASHMNGVVESLIKSVRQAIEATCKNRSFSEEQWRTFLAETTYLVNSRPLYPSSEDIWECPPITPNDLLINPHIPPPSQETEDRVNPRDRLRSTQKRVNEFWLAWKKYFAPTLLPRNKWYRTRENLQEGDLVLEIDSTPRRKWKMALVEKVYPGTDGLVRKVLIRNATGEYDRPIHKLCLIATKQELTQ